MTTSSLEKSREQLIVIMLFFWVNGETRDAQQVEPISKPTQKWQLDKDVTDGHNITSSPSAPQLWP